MTKRILFIVFLLHLMKTTSVADPTLSIEIPDPVGPVLSIKTEDHNHKPTEARIYDKRGNLLKISIFDEDGHVYSENEYEFDSHSIKIKHIIRDQAFTGAVTIKYGNKGETLEVEDSRQGNVAGNKPIQKWIYKYAPNGNLFEKIGVYQNGDVFEKTAYHYNNDKLDEERKTRRNKPGESKVNYEYNTEGKTVKVTYTDYEGRNSEIEIFDYDRHGNKIALIENNYYEGSPRSQTVHTYDSKGNMTQRITFNTQKMTYFDRTDAIEKRSYSYDKKGLLSGEVSWDSNGRLAGEFKYSYDDKRNLTEEAFYMNDKLDSKSIYKYEYDAHGNWTKRAALGWNYMTNKIENAGYYLQRTITYR